MRFGIAFFATDDTLDPASAARAAERAGFPSIFVTEHTHIPVDHSPHAVPGPALPPFYKRPIDPFAPLAAMASVTTDLRLGFGVNLVGQHDPIELAKSVA